VFVGLFYVIDLPVMHLPIPLLQLATSLTPFIWFSWCIALAIKAMNPLAIGDLVWVLTPSVMQVYDYLPFA